MSPTLSPIEQYILALMETEVPEKMGHARAILDLMDATQPFEVFCQRCVCIPMVVGSEATYTLKRNTDQAVLFELMKAERPQDGTTPANQEIEAKIDEMLAVAHQAFCEGDQPLMPMMMLGAAQWLILYKPDDFAKFDPNDRELNMMKEALVNPPLALSLMQAAGEPARWLFNHLGRQAEKNQPSA